jgi:rsbT co-antagonist protein RsbR
MNSEAAGHDDVHFDLESLAQRYAITDADLERVRAYPGDVESVIEAWYTWLEQEPEFEEFFSDPDVLARVQALQTQHWKEFFAADLNADFRRSRQQLGETHARIGLTLNSYFAGVNMFMELLGQQSRGLELPDREETMHSLAKLLHLETAVVVDTYHRVFEETITAQAKSLMEMSTPVTQIWAGILLLPIVGIIDSHRASDIMNSTLAKIAETQAQIFILDISGVGVVDTAVANNLIKITRATRLMGCECTISGVSPAIAQTIVDLGIDVGRIKTTATMRDALDAAFRRVGQEIRSIS